jgi:hypothetical protein
MPFILTNGLRNQHHSHHCHHHRLQKRKWELKEQMTFGKEVPGIEPRASHMLSMPYTTEPTLSVPTSDLLKGSQIGNDQSQISNLDHLTAQCSQRHTANIS